MNELLHSNKISPTEVRERIAVEGVSSDLLAEIISSMSPSPVHVPIRGAKRTNHMALTNLTFRQAEQTYPHLFAYI